MTKNCSRARVTIQSITVTKSESYGILGEPGSSAEWQLTFNVAGQQRTVRYDGVTDGWTQGVNIPFLVDIGSLESIEVKASGIEIDDTSHNDTLPMAEYTIIPAENWEDGQIFPMSASSKDFSYTVTFQVKCAIGQALTAVIPITTSTSRAPDGLELFTVDHNNVIKTAALGPQTGQKWAGWWQICGGNAVMGTPITALSREPNKLDAFVVGLDNRIYHSAWDQNLNNGQWRGWWSVAGGQSATYAEIGAVSRAPNLLDIFLVGNDGNIYTAAWEENRDKEGQWRGWWPIAEGRGKPGSLVSAAARGPNNLDVFIAGLDGRVRTAAWGPQTNWDWAGWWPILDLEVPPGAPITPISRATDWLDIFVVGSDGGIYSAAWNPAFTDGWHGWWLIQRGKATPGSQISVVSRGSNILEIFILGEDNRVWRSGWYGGDWGPWSPMGNTTFHRGSRVSAVSRGENIDLFVIGNDLDVWTISRRMKRVGSGVPHGVWEQEWSKISL